MIDHVEGVVDAIGPTWVVLTTGGIGFRCPCPPRTAAGLSQGQRARLATSLVVREDSMTLYAFAEPGERDAFELVQSASGVGPKIAQAVVSVLTPEELTTAVLAEDLATLCRVPGIGRKGAQKLVIELKDRVAALGGERAVAATEGRPADELWREQVSGGLEGLGWSQRDAAAACDRVAPLVAEDPSMSVAALMRAALRTLAK